MDLGSAVLSAELALELLDDDARDRVVLCPAPLVEGLVAAAVAAAGGGSREEVAVEAVAGLSGNKPIFVRSPKAPAWPERPEPAVPLLAALGVRELSVAPPAIPAVKEAVRATSLDRATGLAARALDLPGAAGVPALLAGSSPDVD